MFDHSSGTVERARRLRREMTLPEGLLWQILRTRPMGLKFRNQHPVSDFVADFYCHAAKTVIEIDGIAHDMGDQPDFDSTRDAKLRMLGFDVLRIPAADVMKSPGEVASNLVAHCMKNTGAPH